MIYDKIKALEKAKAQIARLEEKIDAQLSAQLAGLPAKYGFDSAQAFIKAVKAASGGKRRGRPAKAATGGRRRKRAIITDATRAAVKKQLEEGKTGTEIAKSLKISLPSVQNIKKAFGLVKPRKK